MKSTPSTTPIGLAVMKLPLATRMSAPAIGELGSPIESAASISTRSRPLASLAHVERHVVGHAQALVKAAAAAALLQLRLDLGARAVHQHQPHAESGEQVQVVREVEEAAVGHHLAAERDDESLAAEGVDIGRDRLEPVDEAVLRSTAAAAAAPARRGSAPAADCRPGPV